MPGNLVFYIEAKEPGLHRLDAGAIAPDIVAAKFFFEDFIL
jgi:hypothetical protein